MPTLNLENEKVRNTFRCSGLFFGGGKGTRTPNPLLAKQVRYQLRHTPKGFLLNYQPVYTIRNFDRSNPTNPWRHSI